MDLGGITLAEERVYGKKIDINTQNTVSFYNQRAKTIDNREQEYTTVLLGDQSPEYAVKWDMYEKDFIIPKLHLNRNKIVLDLGCGIGRWADSISGDCKEYIGVDFSGEMISIARQKKRKGDCLFYNLSVLDALDDKRVIGRHYDIIIVTGVSMYINDDMLVECYRRLDKIVDKETIIYFEESVGKKERLTLNNIWSENLNDYYGAIYRTREEYLELIGKNITSVDYIEEGYMDVLDKKEQSETSHWYSLFRSCKGE